MILGMSLRRRSRWFSDHQPDRHRSGPCRDVRNARPATAGRPDLYFPAVYDPDQRHGLLFPFNGLTPGLIIGTLSLVLLAIACVALYVTKLSGPWRWIYVVTALLSLYFNVFAAGDPELPQNPGFDGAGAGQSALRTVLGVVQAVVLVFFVLMMIGAGDASGRCEVY